jgi:hypothetical protein
MEILRYLRDTSARFWGPIRVQDLKYSKLDLWESGEVQ